MDALTALQIMVDSGLCILIWIVQLIIYPSFRYTEKKDFIGWHSKYTRLIGLIVSPLMLIQAGIEVAIMADEVRLLRILMIGCIWITTFSLSIPCHNKLHQIGKDIPTINRLISTNWIRTFLWSLLFIATGYSIFSQLVPDDI